MSIEKPLVDSEYLLQKFPGKGGWTFVEIPEVLQNKNNPFGWVKVKGSIDGFELKQYKLMPMGKGKLFLPVKSTIRRKINKQQGDYVHIILFLDNSLIKIPEEILECFETEPTNLLETFLNYTDGEKKAYLDWIYEAKTDETKANRILRMIDRLSRCLKFNDK